MEMEASERTTGISTGHSGNLPVAHLIHGLLFVGTVGRNTLVIRDKHFGALRISKRGVSKIIIIIKSK